MLADSFNSNSGYNLHKVNDYVLSHDVKLGSSGYTVYTNYDFLARTATTFKNETGLIVRPFSEIDRESLEFFHAQLKKLGGTPPPLPNPAVPLQPRRLQA